MSSETKEREQGNAELIDISTIIDDVWKGIVKFWWLFFLLTSVCASLLYFKTRREYVPVYTAYATYIITGEDMYSYSDSYNQKAAEQIGKIFPYILSSDVLKQLVTENMGLEQLPGTISSSVMEGTNLITVKAQTNSPQTSYDLLEAFIESYPKVAQPVIGETNMSIMDESGVPTKPDNLPSFKRRALKGGIIGFGLAFILAVFYALTRNTVKKEEDLKKFLNIRCLGVLPKARFKKRGKVKNPQVLLDNEMAPSAFVEANRTVRTRLEKTLQEKRINTFLVTSAIAGEGKTTVACNTALALVKRGYSVLLIDGDLRKPAVAATLGIEPGEAGLYEILTKQATLRQAAVQYKDTGLRVITGSRPIMNTQRVLNGKGVREIMRSLRYSADFVIIDTPPSAVLSDAAVIAQYVKGAVFVVRQDYAKVDEILEGIESIADTGIQLMGCVLNNAQVGITGYGYGYGYGYGRYGYGRYGHYGSYGYGNTKKSEKEKKNDNKTTENKKE